MQICDKKRVRERRGLRRYRCDVKDHYANCLRESPQYDDYAISALLVPSRTFPFSFSGMILESSNFFRQG